jgi:hypothetical protein
MFILTFGTHHHAIVGFCKPSFVAYRPPQGSGLLSIPSSCDGERVDAVVDGVFDVVDVADAADAGLCGRLMLMMLSMLLLMLLMLLTILSLMHRLYVTDVQSCTRVYAEMIER